MEHTRSCAALNPAYDCDCCALERETIERMKMAFPALIDADHLADVAEKMLGALNKVHGAQEKFDLTGYEADREALEQAEESSGEYWRAIQSAVYEYRKRAERARAAMVPNVKVSKGENER